MIFFRSKTKMNESRTKKVSRNILYSVGTFFVNFLVGYVSRIIFLKVLDASYLGINGLFSNVIGILSLADLGIGTAMMYSLYKPISENDTKKIASLISFFKKVYLGIAISVFVLGILLIPFLPNLVKLENPIEHLSVYYILSLLNTVVSYLFVYRTILITADQKNYIVSKYTILVKVFTFVFQTIVLFLTKNYILYLTVTLIISFLGNLAQNIVALKLYPYLKEKSEKLPSEEKRNIFENVKSLFIYKFCAIVQTNTDNILISVMVGTIFVGYYSNYLVVINVFVSLLTMIFQAVKASVGNLIVETDSEAHNKNVFDILELITFWIVGLCTIGNVVLFQDFIELSFGKQFQLSLSAVLAICANFYTGNIRQTIWTFRETSGFFKETKHITFVTSIINVFLSIVCGYFWDLEGILWATVISRMLYAWWKEPKIMFKKLFGVSCKSYLLSYIVRVFVVVCMSFGLSFICSFVLMENIFLQFLIKFLIVVITVNLVFVLYFYKTKEFSFFKGRFILPILNKLKKALD